MNEMANTGFLCEDGESAQSACRQSLPLDRDRRFVVYAIWSGLNVADS
jgi:hypothetical protein